MSKQRASTGSVYEQVKGKHRVYMSKYRASTGFASASKG